MRGVFILLLCPTLTCAQVHYQWQFNAKSQACVAKPLTKKQWRLLNKHWAAQEKLWLALHRRPACELWALPTTQPKLCSGSVAASKP